ncbi:hypothetical protein HPP92_000990 [Vanilla planifolia]|uniref:Probable glutathione S-transferase GSTU1 n=1 Tax=Vanilla planifolia TaxID=51239 RepID=A0A835VD55_VANPL|nr:hypothetical protein HPP92_000990 [Vanilla planifolia]
MAEFKKLKLLDFWVSPYGIRCRLALAEKEVEYDLLEQNLQDKSELLLKSNPVHKKIPVLLHDGKAICESLIIVQYIDEVFPGKSSILPSDPYARSHARFWADFVDKKVAGLALQMWKLGKGEELDETIKDFKEVLRTLETELGENKYFGGDEFGLVDIALVPFTSWFYSFKAFADFSVEKECPGLAKWAKRCEERESVAKVLPDPKKVYELFYARRKKMGIE